MKYILSLLTFLFSIVSFAQVDTSGKFTNQPSYGFQYKNIRIDSSLRIPRDTFKLRFADSGAVAYKAGAIWQWNGSYWTQIIGGAAPGVRGAKNVGGGYEIFRDQLGDTLRFRTIVAGQKMNISLVNDTLV